jgi:hypothetical protein
MARYSAELRMAVGRLLARKEARRGELRLIAEVLDVEPRTLRNWRAQAGSLPKMGRPPRTEEEWRRAVWPVARAWKSLGRSSGRPRVQVLLLEQGHVIADEVVRALLAELKRRRRRTLANKLAAERVHVHVEARDALWSGDGSHLGREGAEKVVALAVKDVATTRSLALSIGGPPRALDTLALLCTAERERGTLPHVVVLDNGPENRNRLVMAWLAARHVTVLWNVPHTPEHNSWAECFNGELKEELRARGEFGKRGAHPSPGPGSLTEAGGSSTRAHFERCVPRALATLQARPRPSRGGLTAAQLDGIRPRAEDLVQRARFYETACAAIEAAVQGIHNARARRRAEREAILCTLERFGLVTRTRGRGPATCSKAERLS